MSDIPAGPVGPYTPALRAGDWLICSGQIPIRDGALLEGSVAEQTTQCIANLEALLASEGADLAAVAKTMVFLTDMSAFAEMNDAYVTGFDDHRPARSAIGVAALPMGAQVEIEAWAYLGGRSAVGNSGRPA